MVNLANTGKRLIFRLHQALSLQDFVGPDAATVKCIAHYPPSNYPTVAIMMQNPILFLKNGELYQISKNDESWEATLIGEKIEHFWSGNHFDDVSHFQTCIWLFDGHGARIVSKRLQIIDHAVDFGVKLDFYPLAVMIKQGVIVGIQQHINISPILELSQFSVQIKTDLFIHQIIHNLLLNGLNDDAFEFASCYQDLEYFDHALEILLHTLLEESEGKKGFHRGDLLVTAINLVQKFPMALQVIVNCARKSEMSLWSRFFSATEDPKTFYYVIYVY